MKERCLESWLNSVLVEHCYDEYFDPNIANSALKKMGVDENSLMAKGLSHQDVVRLYRGLFVFGMGFNDLLREISRERKDVVKTIWRIYSTVLEYCSRGGMETAIGELDRENSRKVAEMTEKISQKQEIIEKNEEINEARNHQVYKEVKHLREQNVNLKNEKTVLQEEFNSTDQAFTEEVNLRLKFETKINDIYGLHRELAIKHQKLFSDLSAKMDEFQATASNYHDVSQKFTEFRALQVGLREEYVMERDRAARLERHLKEVTEERIELFGQLRRLELEVVECKNKVREYIGREKQWEIEKKSMQAMIELREKSAKETHNEYQITLEENNRLYIVISDQRKVMESYEK